jgi:photosystem II stability/assembly factor-like uncharacterized protein
MNRLKLSRLFLMALMVAAIGVSLAGAVPTPARTRNADISSLYTWKPMVITAGGWVTGMVVHPTTPNVIYARTDVGGAWKWDANTQRWTQIFTEDRFEASYINTDDPGVAPGVHRARAYQVESIALAPSNANIVFLASGNTIDEAKGVLFRSVDGGNTFQKTNLNGVAMYGNGDHRFYGERIAVDPNNTDIVYFGSRKDGVWRSTNGGIDWTLIPAATLPFGLPVNGNAAGIVSIVFDPASPLISGRTSRIYAAVAGEGVYKTEDAGVTWSNISTGTNAPNTGALGTDFRVISGTLYAAFPGGTSGSQGLRKYTPAGGWVNISPPSSNVEVFAVDPFNNQRIFTMDPGVQNLYRTLDGGATWTRITRNTDSPNAPWFDYSTAEGWLSTGELIFDPFTPNTLWFAEGFAVWRSTDLADDNMTLLNVSDGIEETVPNDVIAPPGGKPITGIWDQIGFRHDNLDAPPTKMNFSPNFAWGGGYSYFPSDPSYVVGVAADNRGCCGDSNYSGYSTDGGQTWTQFAAITNNTLPPDLNYWGQIALSASSKDNMVWAPYGRYNGQWPPTNDKPYYTTDRGATWTKITYFDNIEIGNLGGFLGKRGLTADYVNPSTFYFYTWGKLDGSLPAKLHRSTDGGANWTTFDTALPRRVFHGQLKAVPGKAGHLWFVAGYDHRTGPPEEQGLFRSTDGGETFTRLPNVELAWVVAYGKAAQNATYPTIYLYGRIGGQWGVYRSLNEGATWDFIADYPMGYFSIFRTMAADWDVFGRIYLGVDSAGFIYSTTTENPNVPTPTNTTTPATSTNTPTTTLTRTPTNTPTVTPTLVVHASLDKASPETDGSIGPIWSARTVRTLSNVQQGVNTPSRWRGAWDNNYLYVLGEADDTTPFADSGSQWYNDDAFEVFIDSVNAKPTSYGAQQFQFVFRRGDSTIYEGQGRPTTGILQTQVEVPGVGWRVVARFPWSVLGISAPTSSNYLIGFEAQVDDDTNGADRDNQVNWFTTENIAWQNPSVFANVQLLNNNATATNTPTATTAPPRADTIGVYNAGMWYLRNTNTTGVADINVAFGGDVSDLPVVGDWNGDGVDTIGVYRNNTGFFYLSDSNTAPTVAYSPLFGNPGDQPFAGRWDATMTGSGIGVYRNSNGVLYQRKSLTSGVDDFFAIFGNPGDQPIAGDWEGNGFDSIGVYRSSAQTWFMTNNSTPSGITFSDIDFVWDIATTAPVVGDWDADLDSTVGYLTEAGVFALHPNNATTGSDNVFAFGPAASKPVAGKWSAPSRPASVAINVGGAPGYTNAENGDAD